MLNAETRLDPPAQRHPDALDEGAVREFVEFSMEQIDLGLPAWARRSHPVIRRHLGAYWKTFTPDIRVLVRMFLIQAVVTLMTVILPIMYTFLVPTVTVSLVMLPIAGWMYAGLLYNIGSFAAASVSSERRYDTLSVLRTTPLEINEILFSKGAAAIWRYIEDLNLITLVVLLTSLPLLLILFNEMLRNNANPLLVALIVIGALASSTVRLFLESVMMAAIGMMMGAANFTRSGATLSTLLTAGGYFALINLARLLRFGTGYLVLIEIVLPLVLPILITAGCLALAAALLTRD